MLNDKELFDYKKECLFQSLQRNLEWAKRTNEISNHAKNWCVAYWLIYVGSLVKDSSPNVTLLQICVGVLGILFFLVLDAITHYYSYLWQQQRNGLNKVLVKLPDMNREELNAIEPLPSDTKVILPKRKFRLALSMLGHETLLFFYFGLSLMMLIVLIALRYFGRQA
jgi:hypothetical protein